MRFASLGSGSEGNALLVETLDGGTPFRVLVDCGFGRREAERRLRALGCEPASLDSIDTISFTAHEKGRAEVEVKSLSLIEGKATAPAAASRCAGKPEELPEGLRCTVGRASGSTLNLAAFAAFALGAALIRRRRAR